MTRQNIRNSLEIKSKFVIVILVPLTSPKLTIESSEIIRFHVIRNCTIYIGYSYVYLPTYFEYPFPFLYNVIHLVTTKVFKDVACVYFINRRVFIIKLTYITHYVASIVVYVNIDISWEDPFSTPKMQLHNYVRYFNTSPPMPFPMLWNKSGIFFLTSVNIHWSEPHCQSS